MNRYILTFILICIFIGSIPFCTDRGKTFPEARYFGRLGIIVAYATVALTRMNPRAQWFGKTSILMAFVIYFMLDHQLIRMSQELSCFATGTVLGLTFAAIAAHPFMDILDA